jgi:cytochrome c oxidase subunit 2
MFGKPLAAGLPLFPPSASAGAGRTDALFWFLAGITVFFSTLIFLCIFFFAIKYRRRGAQVPPQISQVIWLEVTWTLIPLLIGIAVFVWGSVLYIREYEPPAAAAEIYVVGKQWMWQVQHPEGQREINELHLPAGQAVKLLMTSEDVIHSFFIPAFRMKKDVLPGRYTTQWFEPTVPGRYHLFCTQYCGTNHSRMVGSVYVMEPAAFEQWLKQTPPAAPYYAEGPRQPSGEQAQEALSLAAAGEKLFERLGCITCHRVDQIARCPPLVGVYNKPRPLQDGRIVPGDESYIRESILYPSAKVVAGYPNVMPSFKGQVDELQLLQLIAYIKSLRRE